MALDGNAIGGLLLEIFGRDMTSGEASCKFCGAAGPVAETTVHVRGRERSSAAAIARTCLWSSHGSGG